MRDPGIPAPSSAPHPVLTREARMEPPIQGLKRRSMVLLLAISFRRMLWSWGGGGKRDNWEPLGATVRNWGPSLGVHVSPSAP